MLFVGRFGLGDFGHLPLCRAAATGFSTASCRAVMLPHLIAGDHGKPSAETVLRPIAAEAGQVDQDRGKHLLHQIRRIFGREA